MSEFELAALALLAVMATCQLYVAVRMSDVYAGVWSVAHRLYEWERYLRERSNEGVRRE